MRGSDYRGDIALDGIRIRDGDCFSSVIGFHPLAGDIRLGKQRIKPRFYCHYYSYFHSYSPSDAGFCSRPSFSFSSSFSLSFSLWSSTEVNFRPMVVVNDPPGRLFHTKTHVYANDAKIYESYLSTVGLYVRVNKNLIALGTGYWQICYQNEVYVSHN